MSPLFGASPVNSGSVFDFRFQKSPDSVRSIQTIPLFSPNSSRSSNNGLYSPRLEPFADEDNGFQSVVLLVVSIFLFLL
jgi:hypothetical protein